MTCWWDFVINWSRCAVFFADITLLHSRNVLFLYIFLIINTKLESRSHHHILWIFIRHIVHRGKIKTNFFSLALLLASFRATDWYHVATMNFRFPKGNFCVINNHFSFLSTWELRIRFDFTLQFFICEISRRWRCLCKFPPSLES